MTQKARESATPIASDGHHLNCPHRRGKQCGCGLEELWRIWALEEPKPIEPAADTSRSGRKAKGAA